MTDLTKRVQRRSRFKFGHYGRRLVIVLEPGDLLAMRLERCRTVYRAGLGDVYRQLAIWHADAERKRKRAERQQRRFS